MAKMGIEMGASLPERMTAMGFDEPGGPDVLRAEECPLPEPGEVMEVYRNRVVEDQQRLNQAGLSLYQSFLRMAAGSAMIGILSAQAMGRDHR